MAPVVLVRRVSSSAPAAALSDGLEEHETTRRSRKGIIPYKRLMSDLL